MRKLWNFVKVRFQKDKTKQNVFLLLNTGMWSILGFAAGLVLGLIGKQPEADVLWDAILVACYAGSFGGFMGGCIFIMRNTPEQEPDKQIN